MGGFFLYERSHVASHPLLSTEESMETLKKIPLVRMRGKIIKGFGRGSKMLGVPTANMEIKDRSIIEHTPAGIYAGWARIEGKPDVYKTVLSIGWNPFFKDIKEKDFDSLGTYIFFQKSTKHAIHK